MWCLTVQGRMCANRLQGRIVCFELCRDGSCSLGSPTHEYTMYIHRTLCIVLYLFSSPAQCALYLNIYTLSILKPNLLCINLLGAYIDSTHVVVESIFLFLSFLFFFFTAMLMAPTTCHIQYAHIIKGTVGRDCYSTFLHCCIVS